MKQDIGSNFTVVTKDVSATGAAVNGASIDHSNGSTGFFEVYVKTAGTSVDMKSQYSDDGSTWVDYPAADAAKNDDAITQIVADDNSASLNIPTPRGRYSRAVVTSVGTTVCTLVSIKGPLNNVDA